MSNTSSVQTTPGDEGRGTILAKRGRTAALAVAAVAIAVIAYKESRQSPAPASAGAAAATSASGRASEPAAGTVLLFADPNEAESSCGCGQIIRLVRGAAARGVAVRELAPGSDRALEREHRVTVRPTVLFLGSDGKPLAFAGGVVTGLTPCCLPLYPAAAATCCAARCDAPRSAFWNAGAFVAGVAGPRPSSV